MNTTPPPATRDEIVSHFLTILAEEGHAQLNAINWCTDVGRPSIWAIPGTDTYINGMALDIDLDYIAGTMLELVDRTTKVVSYCVVVTFYGPKMDEGEFISWEHDSALFDSANVGTFFHRNVEIDTACEWAVRTIFGLIDSWYDRKKADARHR